MTGLNTLAAKLLGFSKAMQTRSVNSVSCPCPSFPVSKEPFPHSRIFLVVSMLHYEIVVWNSLWSYIKVYNEERWKRKEEDGLMIKLNIRMELKTKKTKTDPLLITTGLISPNFGHLYQTCLSSRRLLYGFLLPSVVWNRLRVWFIHPARTRCLLQYEIQHAQNSPGVSDFSID